MVAEQDQASVWPEDVGWRVRSGAGLLIHTPMSPERRAAFDREEERERKAVELEEETRRTAALEHRWELERRGVVPHTVGDVLQSAAFGMDRTDRIEARKEREGREAQGLPEPRLNRWEVEASVAAAEAEREVTAATQAELRKVKQATESGLSEVRGTLEALKDTVVDILVGRKPR
jgi:hypothetical protein